MELTITGSGKGISVSDAAFAKDFNEALVHQVVTAYMAAGRQGTKAQKHVLKLAVVVKSHGVRRALVALVQAPFVARSGVQVA